MRTIQSGLQCVLKTGWHRVVKTTNTRWASKTILAFSLRVQHLEQTIQAHCQAHKNPILLVDCPVFKALFYTITSPTHLINEIIACANLYESRRSTRQRNSRLWLVNFVTKMSLRQKKDWPVYVLSSWPESNVTPVGGRNISEDGQTDRRIRPCLASKKRAYMLFNEDHASRVLWSKSLSRVSCTSRDTPHPFLVPHPSPS